MGTYFFDNQILKQFILSGADIQVMIDGQILDIASADDVADHLYGYGSDLNGKVYKYKYKHIDAVIADGNTITIDDYVKSTEDDSAAFEKPEPDEGGEGEGGDDGPPAEDDGPPAEDEGPPAEGGDEGPPAEDEGPPAEDEGPPDEEDEGPPTESRRIKVGDYILNNNMNDEYFNTKGEVVLAENRSIIYQFYSEDQNKLVRRLVARKHAILI